MVRRSARLDADQTRRLLLEECQDRAALQLAADDHLASGIGSVNLEHRLGEVETDSAQIYGTPVPVEEPFTASTTDVRKSPIMEFATAPLRLLLGRKLSRATR